MKINRGTWYFLIIYGVSLLVLSQLWYTHPVEFHFFDDSREWLGIDKIGHWFTAYLLSLLCVWLFSGNHKPGSRPDAYWAIGGFLLMIPIEIMDGFSANYGASVFDLMANLAGSLTAYVLLKLEMADTVYPKFSFHFTSYALLRPQLLGSVWPERILKDYNGQTYWISIRCKDMPGLTFMPYWLLLSIGYSADGLLGGHDNKADQPGERVVDYSYITRANKIILSFDLDGTSIPVKNKYVKYILNVSRCVKVPAPAIEFNSALGLRFHFFYF
jgi:hypothetical protein